MKPINGIYPTQCVTFPRSGHIILQRVLKKYFGDKLNWTDVYKWPERGFAKNKECNLEKTHDFDLDVPIKPDRLYLVQIRNPFNALAGWKVMHLDEGVTKKDWRPWFRQKARYWMQFTHKWLYSPVPNRLVVPYEKLTGNPVYAFSRIIVFMTKSEPDLAKLTVALGDEKLSPRESKPVPYDTI